MRIAKHPKHILLKAVKADLVTEDVKKCVRQHVRKCYNHCRPAWDMLAPARPGSIPRRDLMRMSQDYVSANR